MEEIRKIALGMEEAYVGRGAAKLLGECCKEVGTKALVISGNQSWAAAMATGAEWSLDDAGVPHERYAFSGYCSETNVSRIRRMAAETGCDVLVGAGGGKCMDATKSAADLLGLPCVLLPTSCATCASNVRLCVWYDDEGRCVPGMFAKKSAHALLVDPELIVRLGDARLLAAGMMDALAKYPEIDFSLRCTPEKERSAMLITAQKVAWSNFRYILSNGREAREHAAAGLVDHATENMVLMNIMMTGLASSLVAGVQQLAVAHMFHDAVATKFHDQRVKYLHGEVVAVGVLLQMHSNGYDEALIQETEDFLASIGGPRCLSDLDIAPNEENKRIILDFIAGRGYDEPKLFASIERAYGFINR